MKTVTEKQIFENVEKINKLVDEKLSEPNKTTIKNILNGNIGEMFFTSPASGKTKYHLAVPGGLAQHVLNVHSAFQKLNETFATGFSEEDMFLCALLHDFGKICTPDMKSPHYKTQESKWHADRGEPFESDYSKGYLTNRDRTSFLMQALGIKLNFEQFQALILADGFFTEQNKSYSGDNSKFALYMHFADFIATLEEKE